MTEKSCSTCNLTKKFHYFHKMTVSPDGFAYECKDCKKEYEQKYRERNRKKNKERVEYPDKQCYYCKIKKSSDSFYKNSSKCDGLATECKECSILKSNKYHHKNKEDISKRRKKYRKENREKILKQKLIYRENNREALAQKQREYAQTPSGKIASLNARAKRRAQTNDRLVSKQDWLNIMNITGYCCFYCNIKLNNKNRTVDHVISLNKNGAHNADNLVPCCLSCNSSKGDKHVITWLGFKNINLAEHKMRYLKSVLYKKVGDELCS